MPGETSFRFARAIVRAPGASAIHGLRANDRGDPDLGLLRDQHRAYVAALRGAGAEVIELPALEAFPDSLFVEDAALCLAEGAVVLRPGAKSRLGEAEALRPDLRVHIGEVVELDGPGFADGGDILRTEREVLVGLSARTDRAGAQALTAILRRWNWPLRIVDTPPGVLHFKTDCALVDAETVLATPRLAASGCFNGYRVIETAPGEDPAANAVRFNDVVLLAEGYPATAERLDKEGYHLAILDISEAAKLDGGLSCLSLRLPR